MYASRCDKASPSDTATTSSSSIRYQTPSLPSPLVLALALALSAARQEAPPPAVPLLPVATPAVALVAEGAALEWMCRLVVAMVDGGVGGGRVGVLT